VQFIGALFHPVDPNFVFQRLEFRVAGDQFGFAQLGQRGAKNRRLKM
jgi:hypothetical protein